MKPCRCHANDQSSALNCQPKSQSELAWALAKAVEHRLNPIGRAKMYAALGAGESFQTILVILRIALRGRTPLPTELIDDVGRWLDGYAGTDDEADLRDLVDQLGALRPSQPVSSRAIAPSRPNGSYSTAIPQPSNAMV